MPTPDLDSPPVQRFGDQRYNHTKIIRKGVLVDEAAPAIKVEGIVLREHTQVQWAVQKPVGVVSYSISTWAWIEDATGTVAEWWLIETLNGITDNTLYYQYVDGNPIAIQITNIVGVAGVGFTVMRTGLNRP